MTHDTVIVCSKQKVHLRLPQLVSSAGFSIKKCRLVLVKPNVCGFYHPSLELLSSLIQYLCTYADETVIGETASMVHTPERQFEKLGINSLARLSGAHVRTVNLSREQVFKVKVPKPHCLKELELPESVVKANIIVDVPKAGTHGTTVITNALKNLFGLLPQKHKYSVYHPLGMDRVIADIAQVVTPQLNIIDAGENVLIGTDPLAADVVACDFLGIDPLKVEHLKLVSQDRGESLEDFIEEIKIARF